MVVRNPEGVHLAEAEPVEVDQNPAEMNPETVEMPEEAEVQDLDEAHTFTAGNLEGAITVR